MPAARLALAPLGGVLAASLLLSLVGSARAQTLTTLATSGGDGQVVVEVDAYGSFGYQTFDAGGEPNDQGDAIYDPLGSRGPSSTTWESGVYFRDGSVGSTFLTTGEIGDNPATGNLPDPGFDASDATSAGSSFSYGEIDFVLQQVVQDVDDGDTRVGSVLIQSYEMTNPTGGTRSFDLVRYYEGDLDMGSGADVPDGGGHIIVDGEEFVFQTDAAGEPSSSRNLVGITACGGTIPTTGRFEVNRWFQFVNRISKDQALADTVHNDGSDPDEFVDAGDDYDVGIALANEFELGPGESVTYVTTTMFGTLAPEAASLGCGEVIGLCGNGILELAESCDQGPANGSTDCGCQTNCALAPEGAPCGGAPSGLCDSQDGCNGAGSCEAAVKAAGVECREAVGTCDVAETCNGSSTACPPDQIATAGVLCSPAAGACDVAERCDGLSGSCPADVVLDSGTVCHPSSGVCDPAEACDGIDPECPDDVLAADGTTCRAAVDLCDAVETCDGLSAGCPPDALLPAKAVCRAATGECDDLEVCDGDSAECPPDVVAAPGTPCGDPTVASCTAADTCNEAGDCARNDVPDGLECPDNLEFCDGVESCQAGRCAGSGDPCTGVEGMGCSVAEQMCVDCGPFDLDGDGEGDACDEDVDGDGIDNLVEDSDGDGEVDEGETDPLQPDTDGDGLCDGFAEEPVRDVDGVVLCTGGEDLDGNGELDAGETDPTRPDTDFDGLCDGPADEPILGPGDVVLCEGGEDVDGDGELDDGETDPRNPDSDGDCIGDGDEVIEIDSDPLDAQSPSPSGRCERCGNAVINADETCDDDNAAPGDGCSDVCQVEPGWLCNGQPSACQPDDDVDGVVNELDNCPTATNPEQIDEDGDGVGDACADVQLASEDCSCGASSGGSASGLIWLLLGAGLLALASRRRGQLTSGDR